MDNDKVVRAARKTSRILRGRVLASLIRAAGGRCGPGLEVEPGTTLRWGPHSGIRLGANVRFGRGVVMDVPAGAVLTVGDNVKVMHYTVMAASERLSIGRGTQVGESCSLRDSDHGETVVGDLVSSPTSVGRDVWLARGVAVLRGASIGDGARVGANSVVTRSRPVPAGATAVGAPARVVR